jgi:hypothetical protein
MLTGAKLDNIGKLAITPMVCTNLLKNSIAETLHAVRTLYKSSGAEAGTVEENPSPISLAMWNYPFRISECCGCRGVRRNFFHEAR